MVSGTRIRLAAGVSLAAALVPASPLAAQRCTLEFEMTAEECLEEYGWTNLNEWTEEELFKYRKALRVAKAHTQQEKDSTNCDRVKAGTLGAFNMALSREKNEFPPTVSPTYFFSGTAPPGAGGNLDDDAQYIRDRMLQFDGDTLINKHIFAFDNGLFESRNRLRLFEPPLIHQRRAAGVT